MANIVNQYGQVKVGIRTQAVSPALSSLLTSLYATYNADSTGLASLKTSLYAAYNGESNATDSFGSNNGTAQGGLTYVAGKIGNAFNFNGTNSYVSLPNNSLNFTGDFSMSFWVNPSSNNYGMKYLISSYQTGGLYGYGYHLGINQYYDKLQFVILRGNNQPTQQWVDYTFTPNTWHHVVICRKASNYTKYYINGVLMTAYYPIGGQTDPTWNPEYSANQLSNIGGVNNANPFNGKMDAVNFWQKELTQSEVTDLYNSGNGSQYITDLFYKPTTNDALGTNNGTAQGGLTYTPGKIGTAFQFNGTNSYVSFPTNSWNSLVGTDLTISLWVKFASTGNQTLISNMSAPGVNVWNGWEIRLVSGQPIFYSWNNTGNTNGVVGNSVTTNTWYHIVATKRGTTYKIYMNGSLAATGTGTGDAIVNASFYPNIGHLQYSDNFHAIYVTNGTLIDSVNLWPRELTSTEVTELYNSGNGKQYPF